MTMQKSLDRADRASLLGLPAELRFTIYDYVRDIPPGSTLKFTSSWTFTYREDHSDELTLS